MASFGEIAADVGSLINFLPSTVTGSEIVMQVNLARIRLSNALNVSIGSPTVADTYRSLVTNQAAAFVCATCIGYGNDTFNAADMVKQKASYEQSVKDEIKDLGMAIAGRYHINEY